MSNDFDSLFDDPPAPPVRRKPGRPVGSGKRGRLQETAAASLGQAAEYQKRVAEFQADEPDPDLPQIAMGEAPDDAMFVRPVTRTFLAVVFGTEPRRLAEKLKACPIVGYSEKRKAPLYDFKEAVSYIVEPKADIASWILSQNSMSLPPAINKAFWDAMRSRQMVEERAADLWRTSDVLDVLGRTALNIKDTAKLWIEDLPGKAKMTTEQYESLRRAVDDLLADIHQRLVEMPTERKTKASVAEYDTMLTGEPSAAE